MTPQEIAEVRRQAAAWRGAEVERGFSMALGRFGETADTDCVAALAYKDDRLAAVLHFVPWGEDAPSLDQDGGRRIAQAGLVTLVRDGAVPASEPAPLFLTFDPVAGHGRMCQGPGRSRGRGKRMRRHGVAVAAAVLAAGLAVTAGAPATSVASTGSNGDSLCIGHHPQEYVWYTNSCTGHDEPEIDPLSNRAGSAQDLTWTVVLPTNGSVQVDSVGPTFWIGGVVSDPTSLFDQAFLELQFYPNSVTTGCTAGGGYNVSFSANTYTACSPVWKVSKHGAAESAAFNAMLTDAVTGGPLTMHAGDTITDHQYVTAAHDGMHITVTDLTTGHSGTIVLNSPTDGPLMPAFSVQKVGNALSWGLVNDAPNALVWEIGHTGNYTTPAGQFCLPGSAAKPPCYSYDVPTWLKFQPLQIKGVTFGDGSTAQSWSAVSDYGGKAEVDQYCGAGSYGTPFCSYPWYAWNGADNAFTYGGDYPGTSKDFRQALQFDEQEDCVSPDGTDPQYCSTVLR